MPVISIDVEVLCVCGREELTFQNRFPGQLIVSPCELCQEEIRQEGYKEGFADGEVGNE